MNKRRRRRTDTFRINVGTIFFSIIFIYIIIRILISLPKQKLAIYEVQNSFIDTNINTTALILRDEKLISAEKSGYVSYYVRDGQKIGKEKTIYTVDETGSIYDKLKDAEDENLTMSSQGLEEVRTRISNFENYFDYSDFQKTYSFRYDIENAVLELTNEALIDQLTTMDGDNSNVSTYKKVLTTESGIVTYYKDGYEGITVENFKGENFNKAGYKKTTLKSSEIINAGDPVYKLITSENWNLIATITDEEAKALEEKDTVRINIHNSPKDIVCGFEMSKKDGKNFIIMSLDQQMVNYINDRYIDIVIKRDQNNGLKIPKESITEKSVLKIPISYLSKGSDTKEVKYFNIKQLDDKGEVTLKQISPDIYVKNEEFCYVDPNDFSSDAVITDDSNNTLAISQCNTDKIKGVFCVNKGITDFRYIDIIYQDDEYCIVKSDVSYSISWYDRIVLDHTMVTENQIIK